MTHITYPRLKVFDAGGNPLAGGNAFTYGAGGLTRAPTYADYAKTANGYNQNPVKLDLAGEGRVFLGGTDSAIKIITKSKDDEAIWTADDITDPSKAPPTSESDTFHAYDDEGNDLAGGLVYIYETGTSTEFTTYSDAALTVENSNPVVLDANGKADIYCRDSYLPKIVLKDANGRLIWTESFFIAGMVFAGGVWRKYPLPGGSGVMGMAGGLSASYLVPWSGTPNDTFDGTNGDAARSDYWTTLEDNATVKIDSNKLKFSSAGGVTSLANSITSIFMFSGDWDVQFDFETLIYGDIEFYFTMRAFTTEDGPNENYVEYGRWLTSVGAYEHRCRWYQNETDRLQQVKLDDTYGSTSGTYRLKRAGNSFQCFWPNGTIQSLSWPIPNADGKIMSIRINLMVINSITVATANNFLINSADSIVKYG